MKEMIIPCSPHHHLLYEDQTMKMCMKMTDSHDLDQICPGIDDLANRVPENVTSESSDTCFIYDDSSFSITDEDFLTCPRVTSTMEVSSPDNATLIANGSCNQLFHADGDALLTCPHVISLLSVLSSSFDNVSSPEMEDSIFDSFTSNLTTIDHLESTTSTQIIDYHFFKSICEKNTCFLTQCPRPLNTTTVGTHVFTSLSDVAEVNDMSINDVNSWIVFLQSIYIKVWLL